MSMTPDPPEDWQKVKKRVQQGDTERKLRSAVSRPVTIVVIVAVLVLGAAAGITAKLLSGGAAAAPSSSRCQNAFVPAFFYGSEIWTQAAESKPAPKVMILDISGMGAGTAPEPHFQSVIRQAKEAGVTILGYSSTAFGARPLGQIEADVRNYKAWYGVTDIFLDEVHGESSQLPYYRALSSYIHGINHGSSVWLNPGSYPAEGYMSVGNVVMAFEGPYSSYTGIHVPSWAYRYSPSRFANTIYATAGSQVNHVINLSRSRNAGYLYVTNRSGSNPYDGLPSYWETENSAITAGCSNGAALGPGHVARLAP